MPPARPSGPPGTSPTRGRGRRPVVADRGPRRKEELIVRHDALRRVPAAPVVLVVLPAGGLVVSIGEPLEGRDQTPEERGDGAAVGDHLET